MSKENSNDNMNRNNRDESASKYRSVDVIGVRVELPSNQPIVLLKEQSGVRYLPIWVGAVEATAIAFAQQQVIPPRPLTHDLFKNVIDELGAALNTVYITEIKDGVFYAQLNFENGSQVAARPREARDGQSTPTRNFGGRSPPTSRITLPHPRIGPCSSARKEIENVGDSRPTPFAS